ncbi:MAG: DUF4062 domain-containing protein [Bacteroidales bacterium]|jgi:hypothetical protein|nr:DUF4062 domain-containing protein [Bacteroidales bacterium]
MKNTNKSKPKVFISSTIYDLRDLRSSLKYWLEEIGYEVLLSDHSDFPVNPNENSYQVCLETIDNCDYFILLIGDRVGGWYDKQQKISITQQEYRHANKKFEKDGSIKIVSFVRKEICDIREDRKGLEKYLEDITSFSSYDKKDISNHSSKIIQDAEFIFNFLQEVGKTEAMKQAINNGTTLPQGNWIYQFSNFRDIITALEAVFKIKTDIAEKRAIFNLREELMKNLEVLLERIILDKNIPIKPITHWAELAYNNRSKCLNENSQMQMQYITRLFMFDMLLRYRRLRNQFLVNIISDGIFLTYDNQLHAFSDSVLHRALILLNESLYYLINRTQVENDQFKKLMEVEQQMRKVYDRDTKVEIDNIQISFPLSHYIDCERVITLSKLILKYLEGDSNALDDFDTKLISRVIFEDEEEKIAKERCTREDVLKWLTYN